MTRLSPHAVFWLTLVRIYLGAYWLLAGLEKLVGGATIVIPSWYHGVLARPLLHNMQTALPLVASLEVLVGLMLIFGLFTRWSGALAFLLAAAFYVTKGNYSSYSAMLNSSGALMLLALLTVALGADFGIDGLRRTLNRRRGAGTTERVEGTPVEVEWPE